MTEEQYKEAKSLNYDINIREEHIRKINRIIKSLKEGEGHNCNCDIRLLGSYQIAEFDLYPLTKKIVEVLVEHLTERKEEYQKEIKELKEKFKKL